MKSMDPNWADMSDYVVHFTKQTSKGSDYFNMLGICASRRIEARTAFGLARKKAPDSDSQKVVCFSEIPLHMLTRLVERRGRYAIGFKKSLLVDRGGGPVLYAYKGTPHLIAFERLMKGALTSPSAKDDLIWKVTPFIEAPGQYGKKSYFFEWEREWRHVGNFSFQPTEVAFLIIPEDLHKAARSFFKNASEENIGPAYFCPYLDPNWSHERIRDALIGSTL